MMKAPVTWFDTPTTANFDAMARITLYLHLLVDQHIIPENFNSTSASGLLDANARLPL
jgi:hypothetical protein